MLMLLMLRSSHDRTVSFCAFCSFPLPSMGGRGTPWLLIRREIAYEMICADQNNGARKTTSDAPGRGMETESVSNGRERETRRNGRYNAYPLNRFNCESTSSLTHIISSPTPQTQRKGHIQRPVDPWCPTAADGVPSFRFLLFSAGPSERASGRGEECECRVYRVEMGKSEVRAVGSRRGRGRTSFG